MLQIVNRTHLEAIVSRDQQRILRCVPLDKSQTADSYPITSPSLPNDLEEAPTRCSPSPTNIASDWM